MKVYLPREFDRDNMYSFIDQVLDSDLSPRDLHLDFDFTRLKFIKPVGVTVLSNLIGRLHKNGVNVIFTYTNPNPKNKYCPMAFLDDSMFFKHYLNESLSSTASLRPTTRPLENVTCEKSYNYLEDTMAWLAGKLRISKESLGDIKTCLSEVFNNIKDHSYENTGSVFIQQYPSMDTVMVAISDFGVGIPKSIQQQRPSLNDADALKLAVQQGFTTKSTPRNRGAGLDILLHNVVENNKGNVYIHSNHGILSSTAHGDGMKITCSNTRGYYPGTLLEIEFRTDTIEIIEEEFEWD